MPPKLKDSCKFTISCNIGGLNILHALCDLGSSINVMPLKTVKELKVGKITPSNMTLTLADSYVTQPVGTLRDLLVHVDKLVFPANFVVLDIKEIQEDLLFLEGHSWKLGKQRLMWERVNLSSSSIKRRWFSRCMTRHRI